MDLTAVQLILQDRKIAYFIADRDLKIVEVSGASHLCGVDIDSCLGRSLLDVIPELVGTEAALDEMLTGKLPRFHLPWINRETPEGQTIYLTMVDLPYRDRAGHIAGLIHLVQDVTEMGKLEQQITQHRNELRLLQGELQQQNRDLAVANTELRRLGELKSEFVSVAAHELRTPLSSIMGYVEILLDEDFGPLVGSQRELLEIVERGARRLLRITNNLLDVNRIETERIELILQPVSLATLVESVAAELTPQLATKSHHLTLRASADLPLALIDETRTAQIISNLLSNAHKYTPDGGRITVSVTQAEEEGFLQLAVADNGVGIAPKDQDKIFTRFFRAESAGQTQASGTGLGLYITRSLVELHGGHIWFESELGQGSAFYVTFPID